MAHLQGGKPKIKGVWDIHVHNADGSLALHKHCDNLTPDVFLEALADQTAGENTTEIGDNLYVALGTDNTAAAAGDTTLGTESTRKAKTDGNRSSTTGNVTVFFTSSEATGTFEEFGLFGDGSAATASASADSGVLYSRVIDSVTVSASQTLTVTVSITYSV